MVLSVKQNAYFGYQLKNLAELLGSLIFRNFKEYLNILPRENTNCPFAPNLIKGTGIQETWTLIVS